MFVILLVRLGVYPADIIQKIKSKKPLTSISVSSAFNAQVITLIVTGPKPPKPKRGPTISRSPALAGNSEVFVENDLFI